MKIDKTILNAEMKKSLDQGKMSEKFGEIVIEMSQAWNKSVQRKKELEDYDYNECVSASIERCCLEWNKFNSEKYSDAFNYITTLISRGSCIGVNNKNNTNHYFRRQKLTPILVKLDDCFNL